MRLSTKKIAYIGVLSALSVVLNMFTFTIPGSNFAVSFTYIPTFISGFFFGPIAGFLVGGIGDLLGCLIAPKGPWMPLITLASALMGLIPGLVAKLRMSDYIKMAMSFILVYFICSAGVNTFALWQAFAATKKTFWVYLYGRMPVQTLVMLLNLTITWVLMPIQKRAMKLSNNNKKQVEVSGKQGNLI